jgi:hypothetical protein
MWPADATTRPHHEVGENDGLLTEYENGTVIGVDGVAAEKCWHRNEIDNAQDLLEAGGTESSPAERRDHPGYPRFETRSFDKLDWRDASIVGPLFIVLIQCRPLPFCPLHAGSLSAHSTIVCLHFLLFSVIHLLLLNFVIFFSRCSANILKQPPLLHILAHSLNNFRFDSGRLVFCRPTDDSFFSTIEHFFDSSLHKHSINERPSWLHSALVRSF